MSRNGDTLEEKAINRELKNKIRKAKSAHLNLMAFFNQYTLDSQQLIRVGGVDDIDFPNAFKSFLKGKTSQEISPL